ncbi:MAG: hypothetical protein A3B99_01110 [Candidatus Yanofskybacteria bacterium RIFCSPHIGHO2_02_FULL_44_12b]|uniref:Uncharacterized protein n=2 Tax=Candidatus Yanofskyibacteriota TaxID=1752733 RepID=A0A1F8GJ35_9BACT|nr:MAG: hypothetical protein UW79_C0009G0032 [Candidatus Yanofskybacteria bacterium GW2011_GWA2_44_9]OGN05425.1 MAG: hypothetical protein A2659_03775 [Candidatus Yanofskybacteria bacterium RIFCSPHIGHO2_01_FULL_44_24]OGN15431.1 MAG: hypothetical protein A3B99_01110 [Candidatus Yanofskybacteria bacterium RIFCSPHIGHO2_02_FULL_44_12b]OGN25415.1 MAG: hypothetical protein A2925_00075 [Candidatus Yanofskybacteria bacterium RIFCSPLOWO2_01_FULL_44_22]
MKKKAALTILGISFLIYGIIFAVDHLADAAISPTPEITPDAATIEKAKNDFLSNICASHGGVNCSIIRPDAAIICNDGTRDESTIIYAVPQCQNAVLSTVEQESDFMARSGCSPPSEMGCFNEQSYQNLYQKLQNAGLASSRLGQGELTQCRQEIADYTQKNNDYLLCLKENNRPALNLYGDRLVLPILKAFFCPMLYGYNATYDLEADICSCNAGYFMSGGQCQEANQICRSQHGQNSLAQNGNCYCRSGYQLNTATSECELKPTATSKTPVMIPTPIITTRITDNFTVDENYSSPEPLPSPYEFSTPEITSRPKITDTKSSPNFVSRMLNSIGSAIKNIINLFK